jgi:hypothetical protein
MILHGFRTKAKQKFSSLNNKLRPKNEDKASLLDSVPENEPFAIIPPTSAEIFQDAEITSNTTTTSMILEHKKRALPRKDVPFVQLPPLDPSRTMLPGEVEFREKIAYFERYSERDMALLRSKRLRVVLEGMRASPLEPAVYKAFEILYQDLYPLRFAGRLIFRRLRQVLRMCVQARTQELELLQNTTRVSLPTLEEAQYAFLVWIEIASDATRIDDGGINNDREHDLVLTTLQLLQSTWLLEKDLLGDYTTDLEALFDPQGNLTTVDFPQWVDGLQRICDNDTVVEAVLTKITNRILVMASEDHPRVLDPNRQTHSERYDAMLDAVREWRALSAYGQGRRWEVLRGCWVGAENEAVREALRIVYVDHPAMRMAGNTIFALVSALIPS